LFRSSMAGGNGGNGGNGVFQASMTATTRHR
jgi:hypothetical protein